VTVFERAELLGDFTISEFLMNASVTLIVIMTQFPAP
jgi:hypothetical protein